MNQNILEIQGLQAVYHHKKETQILLKDIDLAVPRGKVVGVVGESGSGKSMTMKSILNILPDKVTASFEQFIFDGQVEEISKQLPISMIFQDPMTSLNPLRRIGYHLVEVIQRNKKMPKKEAEKLAVLELENVGISLPEKRMKQFPHELSGGMRQRVMIAMALLAEPKLLIADEPTTALDVTIQAQILALIKQLQEEKMLSVILVTHDLGVVAGMCDLIKVMYQGRVVEEGTVDEIFYQATHPYTKQLLQAAHLGDKESILSSFSYNQSLPEELYQKELSETHRVWFAQEEGF
ncbi:MAG TPA: ABC transporter ATP-binding protein [Candidatus Enterococcus avicola]|uniref:ABC transporter ATP-binding protein n=1 Tax=Candidatus Enterococcus avicola TaxID=2838561 RepID=A0A9D2JH08_9ENTE|nr:ABC transporter ATP-binding protein [Candidatus Enterococcus avicola]